MIRVDTLSDKGNNIEICGDGLVVSYEVAKALASFLLVYVDDPDKRTEVANLIAVQAVAMIPRVEEQVNESGTLLKMPRDLKNKILEDE